MKKKKKKNVVRDVTFATKGIPSYRTMVIMTCIGGYITERRITHVKPTNASLTGAEEREEGGKKSCSVRAAELFPWELRGGFTSPS